MDKNKKKKEKEMNSEKYEEMKEEVISMNNIEIYNMLEILIDEINHRKMDINKEQLFHNECRKV